MSKCYFCERPITTERSINDKEMIDCQYCGKYFISSSLTAAFDYYLKDKEKFYKISSWIWEQNNVFKKQPELSSENLQKLLNMRDKKVKEKFDLMLHYLHRTKDRTLDENQVIVQCWFRDSNELKKYFQKAIVDALIKASITKTTDGAFINFNGMTFDGLQYVEELEEPNKSSKNVFVAFNFKDNLNEIFNTHVKAAVEEAGLIYVVVNQNITDHDSSITDEIIVKLKSSRILIADCTEKRSLFNNMAFYKLLVYKK